MSPALRELVELLARAAYEDLRRDAEKARERAAESIELRPEFTAYRISG